MSKAIKRGRRRCMAKLILYEFDVFSVCYEKRCECVPWIMEAIVHRATSTTDDVFVAENLGLGWTMSVQATNSGTLKNHVAIGPYGANGFAMTWIESNATLPPSNSPDSLVSQTRMQEIYAAIKSGSSGWGPPVRITNDGCRDGMPKIAGSNSGLCLVCVRQSEGDVFDRTKMRMVYTTFDGSSWCIPEAIPGQLGYNLQPNLTVDPNTGNAVIVWIEGESHAAVF